MLEGKSVNLRVMENEDLPLLQEWMNNLRFIGEYIPPKQWTKAELEKIGSSPFESTVFIIEKKDGSKIGWILHCYSYLGWGRLLEIGYALAPNERGKGYCVEAVQLMLDYLFLSMDFSRVQATVSIKNKASQRVLEKTGFTREGTIRKTARGERRDSYLYSILREEWKEPKILTKTA